MNLSNPFARDRAEAERAGVEDAYVCARELHYLADAGAIEYLRAPLADLGTEVEAAEPGMESVPKSKHVSLGAFRVYEEVERLARELLPRLTVEQRAVIRVRAASWMVRALEVRRVLLSKGKPVPGRGEWLRPIAATATKASVGLAA